MKQNERHTIKIIIDPFTVEAFLCDENACGGWDRQFTASLTLECNELDKTGFVVENQTLISEVRRFFRSAKYIASCEQLCECIINISVSLGGDRITKATAEVKNLTGHLEVEWLSGQPLPPLARCV